jgi:hypothetical protein
MMLAKIRLNRYCGHTCGSVIEYHGDRLRKFNRLCKWLCISFVHQDSPNYVPGYHAHVSTLCDTSDQSTRPSNASLSISPSLVPSSSTSGLWLSEHSPVSSVSTEGRRTLTCLLFEDEQFGIAEEMYYPVRSIPGRRPGEFHHVLNVSHS